MNETASLERGYRRVRACGPKAFRQQNTEETHLRQAVQHLLPAGHLPPLAHTSG